MQPSPRSHPYAPFPAPLRPNAGDQPGGVPPSGMPPRRPDWLVVLIGVLIVLTLLIAWLIDIPELFR